MHGFTLIGLCGTYFTARRSSRIIWDRIINPHYLSSAVSDIAILLILGTVVLISVFYLSNVSLSETGLYTIFIDPMHSAQAREESFKLIDNLPLRYSYSFLRSTFAPLLAVLLYISFVQNVKRLRIIKAGIAIIVLVCLFVSISLPGARGPIAVVILTIILALFLRKGMPIRPLHIILAIIVVLSMPILFSILREGREISFSLFFRYLVGGIFNRVFVMPMQTGLWHVHYAQTQNFFGIAGIPKLASLFGVEPINVPNVIYLNYFSISLLSGFANTSYVFSYYSYFGIVSFIFSLIGLWFLDLAVIVYRILSDKFLLPCVASILVASISFVSADYTVVILTNGFGILLVSVLILDRLCRYRLSTVSNSVFRK